MTLRYHFYERNFVYYKLFIYVMKLCWNFVGFSFFLLSNLLKANRPICWIEVDRMRLGAQLTSAEWIRAFSSEWKGNSSVLTKIFLGEISYWNEYLKNFHFLFSHPNHKTPNKTNRAACLPCVSNPTKCFCLFLGFSCVLSNHQSKYDFFIPFHFSPATTLCFMSQSCCS